MTSTEDRESRCGHASIILALGGGCKKGQSFKNTLSYIMDRAGGRRGGKKKGKGAKELSVW